MASVLALISKAAFEKAYPNARLGSVLELDHYASSHVGLRPLADGGDLYLVTVRPDDVLWLVGILRAPRFGKGRWLAKRNTETIADASPLLGELRFATGTGLRAARGKLGMSLQTPRTLTEADAALFEGLRSPSPAPAVRHGRALQTLLDLEEAFAVTTFDSFPKKHHAASGTVTEALAKVTSAGAMLLIAGCMLWIARRLARVTDVTRCMLAAEALLCFQDHPAYFGPNNFSEWPKAPDPRDDAERAVRVISGLLWRVYTTSPGSHPLPPTVIDAAGQAVSMVRTALGAAGKKPFESWLEQVLERLQQVALNPRVAVRARQRDQRFDWHVEAKFIRENVGPPLPPSLLDTRLRPEVSTLGAQYAQFLGGVDWKTNPFLATPEVMVKRGFKGSPYVATPGATYSSVQRPGQRKRATLASVEDPYPVLASIEQLPKAQRKKALMTYLKSRGLPTHFERTELELEHAFSLMLGRQVSAQAGTHVALLTASIDVIGDLEFVTGDKRPRIPALRVFEAEVHVANEDDEAREVLLGAVKAAQLDARRAKDGDFVVVRSDDEIVGRVTRAELRKVEDDLHSMVEQVCVAAPSDGSLFDALRYLVQQEAKPWGMSNVVDVSDFIVEAIDPRLERALEAIENRELAAELAAFCDRDGRSARAWQWKGRSFKDAEHGVHLTFVAGIYDGEGVGMDFDVYRVD